MEDSDYEVRTISIVQSDDDPEVVVIPQAASREAASQAGLEASRAVLARAMRELGVFVEGIEGGAGVSEVVAERGQIFVSTAINQAFRAASETFTDVATGELATDANEIDEVIDDPRTCVGCRELQPNQQAHMQPGGCLYTEDLYEADIEDDYDQQINLVDDETQPIDDAEWI